MVRDSGPPCCEWMPPFDLPDRAAEPRKPGRPASQELCQRQVPPCKNGVWRNPPASG